MTGFLLALREWAMPLALALGGFAAGLVLERAGLERLARSRRISESAGMRALLGAACWMVTVAAGIIGRPPARGQWGTTGARGGPAILTPLPGAAHAD